MALSSRFAACWLGFFALFVTWIAVMDGEWPNAFGFVALALAALPVAFVLARRRR